jgi:ethanolamine ammonia-lyase small subunit
MRDPLEHLRRHTRARVGLGRAGDGLPTDALLDFQWAHARARDAVHGKADFERIAAELAPRETTIVDSAAPERMIYLRRPDLGRVLADGEADRLAAGPYDLVFVIADGLSSAAVEAQAVRTLEATVRALPELSVGPVVLVRQGRVAIGDDVAERMEAEIVVVLIGERPGLSSAASLGAYTTYKAKRGTPDSARNCVSNVHENGLLPEAAAEKIAWLVRETRRLGYSGVLLKEGATSDLDYFDPVSRRSIV